MLFLSIAVCAVLIGGGRLYRGRGGKRLIATGIMTAGISIALLHTDYSLFVSVPAYACLFFLSMVYGIGKGFMCIHGADMRHESEFPPVDMIMDRLIDRKAKMDNKIYGTLYLGITGFFALSPLMYFSVVVGSGEYFSLAHIAACIPSLLYGCFYYVCGLIDKERAVAYAEASSYSCLSLYMSSLMFLS